MTDLKFPSSTAVGKPVPKTAFYKHLEVNAKMKQHFVDDVVCIDWLYKIAPSTLNVADGKNVHEIVVFSAQLKHKDCPDDVFRFIDLNMPRHAVFILEYGGECKVLLNYKEWMDEKAGTFRIIKSFGTEWIPDEQVAIPLEGLGMDSIYEAMAGKISGYGTSNVEDTKRMVELEACVEKGKRDVENLQKKIKNEPQLNIQMEMNGEARRIKRQIAEWNIELKKLKR